MNQHFNFETDSEYEEWVDLVEAEDERHEDDEALMYFNKHSREWKLTRAGQQMDEL